MSPPPQTSGGQRAMERQRTATFAGLPSRKPEHPTSPGKHTTMAGKQPASAGRQVRRRSVAAGLSRKTGRETSGELESYMDDEMDLEGVDKVDRPRFIVLPTHPARSAWDWLLVFFVICE